MIDAFGKNINQHKWHQSIENSFWIYLISKIFETSIAVIN